MSSRCCFLSIASVLVGASALTATEPPRGGGDMPDAYTERLQQQPRAFSFKHALMPFVAKVLEARAAAENPSNALTVMEALNFTLGITAPTRVQGIRHAPVLLLQFSDTPATAVYDYHLLQARLFGPSSGLTISQFYEQMSHGLFTVDGTVYAWTKLAASAPGIILRRQRLHKSGESPTLLRPLWHVKDG
jgi:hypothetical protein